MQNKEITIDIEKQLTTLPSISKPEFELCFKALPEEIQNDLHVKGIGWKQFGIRLAATERVLQLRYSKITSNIKHPEKIEDIPAAEKLLSVLKSGQKELQQTRLSLTVKMDEVKERLMISEKSIQPAIDELTKAIISIKSADAKAKQAIQAKIEEEKRIKEQIRTYKANIEAGFKQKINETVTKAHTEALEQKINPDKIKFFIAEVYGKLNVSNFGIQNPVLSFHINTPGDVERWMHEALVSDPEKKTPIDWVKDFHNEIDLKFSAYDVDYANAEAAIEQSKRQSQEKLKEITAEQQNEVVAAKIESSAQSLIPTINYGKALKENYEIDMPDTWETNFKVAAAFHANFSKIQGELGRITKPGAFTYNQMKNYLGKLKTNDNSFDFTGLVWRVIEKL